MTWSEIIGRFKRLDSHLSDAAYAHGCYLTGQQKPVSHDGENEARDHLQERSNAGGVKVLGVTRSDSPRLTSTLVRYIWRVEECEWRLVKLFQKRRRRPRLTASGSPHTREPGPTTWTLLERLVTDRKAMEEPRPELINPVLPDDNADGCISGVGRANGAGSDAREPNVEGMTLPKVPTVAISVSTNASSSEDRLEALG